MKRIFFPYFEDEIKPVVLYLDDLEKIIEILKEFSNNVVIITEEYQLDNLDELQKINKDTLNWLTIGIDKPQISVNFRPNVVMIYIEEDITVSRGVLEKIKQLLHNRRRKLTWFAKGWWVGIFLIGTSLGMSTYSIFTGKFMMILLWCAGVSLSVIWAWSGYVMVNNKCSVIHLERKIDSPSFWKRNKDKITIAIITIAVTTIFNWLIFNFLKKP